MQNQFIVASRSAGFDLQPLLQLNLILIREVLWKLRNADALIIRLPEQSIANLLEATLRCCGDFARMRPRNLSHGYGLPNNEEVLNLPNVISRLAIRGAPEKK